LSIPSDKVAGDDKVVDGPLARQADVSGMQKSLSAQRGDIFRRPKILQIPKKSFGTYEKPVFVVVFFENVFSKK
jgi:hypothetical protein